MAAKRGKIKLGFIHPLYIFFQDTAPLVELKRSKYSDFETFAPISVRKALGRALYMPLYIQK